MKNLTSLFEPTSVAVIGASVTKGSVGNAVFSNLLKSHFNGAVFPVNPKYNSVMSVKAYEDVLAIPDKVDMAVVCVPPSAVVKVVKQCAEKGVKALALITAGFKEIGKAGKELEDEIITIARIHHIALLGPNILGIINTQKQVSLNANFALSMPKAGNVALISQSGAIGVVALDYVQQNDLGISKFVSIGNKAIIDESDVLEYLIDDDKTKIITMYAEDIGRPSKFFEMANKAAAKHKPIIIIKTGRSIRGAIATQSHTGALSSSDTAYDSLFAQCGVIRVTTLEELFECAKGFTCPVQPRGNRMVVVTNGGGMGVIVTDAAGRSDLEMTTFEPQTEEALKKVLPPTANIHNPVDIIGDADAQRLNSALTAIAKDKNVDTLIVSILPTAETDMEAIAAELCSFAASNPDLPILSNLMSLETNPYFEKVLERANIPNFDFPEKAVRVLASMIRYYDWIKQPHERAPKFNVKSDKVKAIMNSLQREYKNHLTEPEAYQVLEAYGLKSVNSILSENVEEALIAANNIGYPVVLKIVSPDIMHKIDVGGVEVDLKNDHALKTAFQEIAKSVKSNKPSAEIQGFLVQKYFTKKGIEVIAGVKAIKGFGHLIMFGSGGTFVELFKDVAFRLAPLTKQDALNMIMETKGYQILKGFRGQPSYDMDAIADYLMRISQLVTDFPSIQEMDMNPIKVLENGQGAIVMDSKIVLEEQTITIAKIKPKMIEEVILI